MVIRFPLGSVAEVRTSPTRKGRHDPCRLQHITLAHADHGQDPNEIDDITSRCPQMPLESKEVEVKVENVGECTFVVNKISNTRRHSVAAWASVPPNILDSLRTQGEEDAVWCVGQGYQSPRVCGCKRRLVISREYSAISKANIFDTLEMNLGIK